MKRKGNFRAKLIDINSELTKKHKIKIVLMLKVVYYSVVFYQN